jgi:hypothetical protein
MNSPVPLRRKKKGEEQKNKKSQSMMVHAKHGRNWSNARSCFVPLEQQQQQEGIMRSSTTSNLVAIVQVEKRFPYKPSR